MLKSLRAFAKSGFAPTAVGGRLAAAVAAVVGSLPIRFGSLAEELGALAWV
ncbi:MAG: hypothetical protein QNJ06_08590 [Kiloniellales bacterium]|nr:hypothetical protein [Kiloniellales bacterium]MDJ0969946.1 hypothetical protein [Kiloniellales bacterium]MDJ0981934.1 hypothetical protein [Kiloniellales bacterium]